MHLSAVARLSVALLDPWSLFFFLFELSLNKRGGVWNSLLGSWWGTSWWTQAVKGRCCEVNEVADKQQHVIAMLDHYGDTHQIWPTGARRWTSVGKTSHVVLIYRLPQDAPSPVDVVVCRINNWKWIHNDRALVGNGFAIPPHTEAGV